MSVYAISPTGVVVRYNSGNYISRFTERTVILTSKDGDYVADVPPSWAISFWAPCSVTSAPMPSLADAATKIADAAEQHGSLSLAEANGLARAKRALRKFHAQRQCWQ